MKTLPLVLVTALAVPLAQEPLKADLPHTENRIPETIPITIHVLQAGTTVTSATSVGSFFVQDSQGRIIHLSPDVYNR